MKLAVTAQNGQVFQHFGKCPSFAVFTVEGKAASAPVLLDATGSGHAAMAAAIAVVLMLVLTVMMGAGGQDAILQGAV